MAKIKTTFVARLTEATLNPETGETTLTITTPDRESADRDNAYVHVPGYHLHFPISPKLLPKLTGLRNVEVTITVRSADPQPSKGQPAQALPFVSNLE